MTASLALTLTGAALVIVGLALIFPPAAVVVAGVALGYVGLTRDVDE